MVVDKTKVGIIRPLKRISEPAQRAELHLVGLSTKGLTYVIGKNGVGSWRDIANQRREGDTAYIYSLALLADPKSEANPYPSMDLRDAMEAFDRKGCTIIEAMTGRSTADKAQRQEMIIAAAKALGQGRSLPPHIARANGAKGGRRKAVFDPEVVAEAKRVWESRKFKTYKDAAAALPKGFSWTRAFREFGKRS